ncbi:MAG: tautomerase family protein [Rhodoblastus sp.]|nr:MAG: tautomerase family protein [Rhodoblastus sp.]
MPIVRTAIPQAFTPERRRALVAGVHEALVGAIGMPDDELFHLLQPYAPGDFVFDRRFNGIARGDDLVAVEISMRRGRSDAMKRALYAAIAENLESRAGVSRKDVIIVVQENDYSDWCMGNGVFAMTLAQQRGED